MSRIAMRRASSHERVFRVLRSPHPLSLSPSGAEGTENSSLSSERERVGVMVAHLFMPYVLGPLAPAAAADPTPGGHYNSGAPAVSDPVVARGRSDQWPRKMRFTSEDARRSAAGPSRMARPDSRM